VQGYYQKHLRKPHSKCLICTSATRQKYSQHQSEVACKDPLGLNSNVPEEFGSDKICFAGISNIKKASSIIDKAVKTRILDNNIFWVCLFIVFI
jgi:hypothetical protein